MLQLVVRFSPLIDVFCDWDWEYRERMVLGRERDRRGNLNLEYFY